MAFRRRAAPRRRFKRRWDMQTYRECERQLQVDTTGPLTCLEPQIFADYVCGIGPSTAGIQNKPGASRLVTFGGGHLRLRYNLAIIDSDSMPCHVEMKFITALIVLPLLEDDVTPAYLPNLAIARSQLSVIPATESDTDENILWMWDDQMLALNVSCLGKDSEDCTVGCEISNGLGNNAFWLMKIANATQHGRSDVAVTIRSKRRLREREALFLVTEIVTHPSGSNGDFTWPFNRNVYFRYAVR